MYMPCNYCVFRTCAFTKFLFEKGTEKVIYYYTSHVTSLTKYNVEIDNKHY